MRNHSFRGTAFFAAAITGLSMSLFYASPALAMHEIIYVAESPRPRVVKSNNLRVSFEIPAHLRAALTTKGGLAIEILTQEEFHELSKDAKGAGSPHGAITEARVEIVRPLPSPGDSALEILYAHRDYLRREGRNISNAWLGGERASSLEQSIMCCYGDPFVSNVIVAISPDQSFMVIITSGRDKSLFRQIVASFRFL